MGGQGASPARVNPRDAHAPGLAGARRQLLVVALFLVVGSVYLLSGPGRIDSIDGQTRFDIARNLIATGHPEILDPYVAFQGIRGPDGRLYSTYGPAPSYLALPLVQAGLRFGDPRGELARFLFSWLNAILAAGAVALLALFYLDLGVPPCTAASCALLAAFASMLWIGATTVLEQGQHALFAVAGLYLAWRAAQKRSRSLAFAAGLAAGTLLLYQLPYALHLPLLALATLSPPAADGSVSGATKAGWDRYLLFGLGSLLALFTLALYNFNRFGALLFVPPAGLAGHPPILGNPLVGIPSLLVSPGKGILLFSPLVLLGLRGLWRLRAEEPRLVAAVLGASALHLLFVGSLSIFHGDWCWGPRYLMVLVPLLLVGLPRALEEKSPQSRGIAAGIAALGLLANLLGLSLVHERYFHERGLPIYFWRDDPAYYFHHSSYFARFSEIGQTLREGIPLEAEHFTNSPYPGQLTYVFVRGGPPRADAPWVRRYRIFFRPRPWPLWLVAERSGWDGGRGFPGFGRWLGGVGASGLIGALLLVVSLRRAEPHRHSL